MTTAQRLASLLFRIRPWASIAASVALAGCSVQGPANGMTREQGDAIIAELKEIHRTLLEQQRDKPADADPAQPAKVQLDDSGTHTLGSATARVILVEFTDYQCPFCKRFHDRTWSDLKRDYVDTGKVRYVVRDMPLSFHAAALPAAEAARCAGEQGKFWPLHDALFAAQEKLSAATIRKAALDLGVAPAAFDQCLKDPATRHAIEADIAEGDRIGVNGTPGFVLAEKRNGKLEGALVLGAQPTAVFTSRLDALLGGAAHAP
ncbi:MAG TPA: DsbA family protein [Steroidobacteraceae bacterium]|nr:DsbA family protein [Steroidobacteraceae bacterium]